MEQKNRRPIFFDPQRKRGYYSKRLFYLFALSITAIIVFFMVNSIVWTDLPQIKPLSENTIMSKDYDSPTPLNSPVLQSNTDKEDLTSQPNSIDNQNQKIIGFFVNWDDNSLASLKKNISEIDQLIPEWLHLKNNLGDITINNANRENEAMAFIRKNKPNLKLTPLINNFNPVSKAWDITAVAELLQNQQSQENLINNLLIYVNRNRFSGISIDFEIIPDERKENFNNFIKELYQKFHPFGLEVSLNIPLEDSFFDAAKLSPYVDYFILMAYDEHSPGSVTAGPIASQGWVIQGLSQRFKEISSNKIVVALGNYGYDWIENSRNGESLTFEEVMRRASRYKAAVSMDSASLNPTFTYTDESSINHRVWFLDASTAFNQISAINQKGKPFGFALWRLGSEDPSVWKILKKAKTSQGPLSQEIAKLILNFGYGYDIFYTGKGEFFRLTTFPKKGSRDIGYETKSSTIKQLVYTKYPFPYTIERWGEQNASQEKKKKIVLSFDDGPDPKYTPRILEILNKYQTPAVFFIIGANASINSHLVEDMHRFGHEIGNHTFSHADISKISEGQLKKELNSTQHLIQGITGRKTVLFRPPYAKDTEPSKIEHIKPIAEASNLGYYIVNAKIDPKDWKNPKAEEIASRVLDEANKSKGSIVLLHDGGGNREQTVKALPIIITELRKQGFEIVRLSELLGVSKEQLMPPLSKRESLMAKFDGAFSSVATLTANFLKITFVLALFLGILRLLFVATLAIFQSIKKTLEEKKNYREKYYKFEPFVSVIIPAYNEAKVIKKTIETVLDSDYQNYEVVIVDDGSQDETAEIISKNFGNHPKVRLFSIENRGKAEAINYCLAHTDADILVIIDADTLLEKTAVSELVSRFRNRKIDAVAGNTKVGNLVNTLTRWQSLEYITSQNLDRRAFEVLNCISVVPGAIGAWRREAIYKCGGFSNDTLAEDADLTLTLLRKGGKIVFEDKAVAYTETPQNISSFLAQRFRWMFGTLQAAWKHKFVLFHRKYKSLGFVLLPNIFIFQIIFPLIAPVIDLMLLFSILWAFWQSYYHSIDYSVSSALINIGYYYLLFFFVDTVSSVIPFLIERKENRKLLFWLPIQRLLYRQLISFVAIKSLAAAIGGNLVGWNKLKRHATAEVKQIYSN